MIEPELLFGLVKQALELGSGQERDGDYVPGSVFSNINHKMSLWNVQRVSLFVIVLLLFSQAGAPLQNLLQNCCLCKPVWFSDGHFSLNLWVSELRIEDREKWVVTENDGG